MADADSNMPDADADRVADAAELILPDEAATEALGAALAQGARAGLYLALQGDLGTGKTTLARALLRTLGVAGRIRSPSFTLVEPYNAGDLAVFHFDFYRFSSADEWIDAGFDEHFDGTALCIVEWPERAGDHLRAPDLRAALAARDQAGNEGGNEVEQGDEDGGRIARLVAGTDAGRAWLSATMRALASPGGRGATIRAQPPRPQPLNPGEGA